jgi:hypothetical protein
MLKYHKTNKNIMEKTRSDYLLSFVPDRFTRAEGIRIVGYSEKDNYLLLVTDQKFSSGKNIGIFINNPNFAGDKSLRDIIEKLGEKETVIINIYLTKRSTKNVSKFRDYPYTFSVSSEEAAIEIVDSESRVEAPYGKQSLEINNNIKNSNPKIIQQTIDNYDFKGVKR